MTADAAWTAAAFALRLATYVPALLAPGGAWFLIAFPEAPATIRRRVARVVAFLAAFGLAATALRLPVTTGHLNGAGLTRMFDRELLAILASSPLGVGVAMAAVGWLLVFRVAADTRSATWVAAAGGLLVVVAMTAAGHASAADPIAGRLLLAIHLAGAAFWLGALWPLWLVAKTAPAEHAARILDRFGTFALVLVGALLAAGTALVVMLLDGIGELWRTRYGLVLSGKLILVAALLTLAALNRMRFVPRLASGDLHAAGALRRTIAAEIALGFLILFSTAVLTTFATPFD